MSNMKLNLSEQFPEGDDLKRFVEARKKKGWIWSLIFQIATIIAILALIALLYNIINSAFGFVALQNEVDPASLVLEMDESKMLTASDTFSSEDDNELVAGIEDNPNAIGFFGYAYYDENQDKLKALSVNGVTPSEETAESGEYPFARPLFIYTTAEVLQEDLAVQGFINYYLSNVDEVISEVGYFPAKSSVEAATETFLQATELEELSPVDPSTVEGSIDIVGSSTVYPISRQMLVEFRGAGYEGGLSIEETGTTGGFRLFCDDKDVDINNASRPIKRAEIEECHKRQRSPLEFRVGTDALAVVVSHKNEFLQNATVDELRQIFTTAETWSEVNPAWPDTPIERFIPGTDSGTLDFFAEASFSRQLHDLSKAELVTLLEGNVSKGRARALEAEATFEERSREDIHELVLAEVVEQQVVQSWLLTESIFNRDEIEAVVAEIPQGEVSFRSWLTTDFLTTPQSSTPENAGILTAILGSLWVIAITVLVSLPLGVGAAIYLEEYASMVSNPTLRRINGVIQTNINNLAGVPSIIYGMLGLAIFVRVMEPITSGQWFNPGSAPTDNGRTILSASLTLALLILPLIIINAQEAIRAVPQSLRHAGMGLGATKWQTIWHHVLPNAVPGILTGNILAMSRAIGETAPLVVIGASTFITVNPTGPFAKFTTLPIQIYQWTSRPQDEFRNIAAAAIIVLLILLLTLNAVAVLMRNRFSRRLA